MNSTLILVIKIYFIIAACNLISCCLMMYFHTLQSSARKLWVGDVIWTIGLSLTGPIGSGSIILAIIQGIREVQNKKEIETVKDLVTKLKIHPGADYILYAKNHYERFSDDGDLWSDLFKLQSSYCGADVEFITKEDVLTTLIHIAQDLVANLTLIDFIADISPDNAWRIWKNHLDPNGKMNWDFDSAVASKCLSLFLGLPVYDSDHKEILCIGEANPDVLPLSDTLIKNKAEKLMGFL